MIRKAEQKDIKIILGMMKQLYLRWHNLDDTDQIKEEWFGSEESENYLKKLIEDTLINFLLYENEGEIIGYCIASIKERKPFLKKTGYIEEMFVLQDFRRKGIAIKLKEKIFE